MQGLSRVDRQSYKALKVITVAHTDLEESRSMSRARGQGFSPQVKRYAKTQSHRAERRLGRVLIGDTLGE